MVWEASQKAFPELWRWNPEAAAGVKAEARTGLSSMSQPSQEAPGGPVGRGQAGAEPRCTRAPQRSGCPVCWKRNPISFRQPVQPKGCNGSDCKSPRP